MSAPPDPHDLPPPLPTLVDCKACGKQVSKTALFCPHCGQIAPGPYIRRAAEIVGQIPARLKEMFSPHTIGRLGGAAGRAWSQLSLRIRFCLVAISISLVILLVACVFHRSDDRFTFDNAMKLHANQTYQYIVEILGEPLSCDKGPDGRPTKALWGNSWTYSGWVYIKFHDGVAKDIAFRTTQDRSNGNPAMVLAEKGIDRPKPYWSDGSDVP